MIAIHAMIHALALGCSNILVTPGASFDGAALVGDNDDNSRRLGAVYRAPAAHHAPGAQRDIYDFDSGELLGKVSEPSNAFNVISRGNDHGVVMSETTHGGLYNLTGGKGNILDYGNLMVETLKRAPTAREAVKIVAQLADEYGYASSMEGFSISDGTECWYMEIIGKGEYGKGLLWVALRVPDGYLTANANQARITQFLPCDDPNTCMMAADVVTFAIKHGLYDGKPTDRHFSFSDIYDPVTPTGARFCEARVWYVFQQLADPADFDAQYYLPYAQGNNLTRRMPLWVRPKAKVSRADVHRLLSSKYEGSWLDPSKDVGAGPEHSPYRWNGGSWSVDGKWYVNERVIGTPATAWHFVASVRATKEEKEGKEEGKEEEGGLPKAMRAILWWGTDDHAWSPKIPLYGAANKVATSMDDADCMARDACRAAHKLPGSMLSFSWESHYWVATSVARLVYQDYERAAPLVACARQKYEEWVAPRMKAAETEAAKRFAKGDEAGAIATLTNLTVSAGEEAHTRWQALWSQLMVAFNDGGMFGPNAANHLCGCEKSGPKYDKEWLRKVVVDTGERYRYPTGGSSGEERAAAGGKSMMAMLPMDKLQVPGVLP